jgi:hypothetical protein
MVLSNTKSARAVAYRARLVNVGVRPYSKAGRRLVGSALLPRTSLLHTSHLARKACVGGVLRVVHTPSTGIEVCLPQEPWLLQAALLSTFHSSSTPTYFTVVVVSIQSLLHRRNRNVHGLVSTS